MARFPIIVGHLRARCETGRAAWNPNIGPLCGGRWAGRDIRSANKLLTGDPETIDIIQHMETVSD